MLERLKARARATGLDCAGWADAPLEELISALLDELRTPTEAMADAIPARRTFTVETPLSIADAARVFERVRREDATALWQAMVDAANEKGPVIETTGPRSDAPSV